MKTHKTARFYAFSSNYPHLGNNFDLDNIIMNRDGHRLVQIYAHKQPVNPRRYSHLRISTNIISKMPSKRTFMDVAIGTAAPQRIMFELDADRTPITVEK